METERILNEYEAWRRTTLERGPDVSVGAYLSHLRTELCGDILAGLAELIPQGMHSDITIASKRVDQFVAELGEAGFYDG